MLLAFYHEEQSLSGCLPGMCLSRRRAQPPRNAEGHSGGSGMGLGSVWSCPNSGLLPPGHVWPGLGSVSSSQLYF